MNPVLRADHRERVVPHAVRLPAHLLDAPHRVRVPQREPRKVGEGAREPSLQPSQDTDHRHKLPGRRPSRHRPAALPPGAAAMVRPTTNGRRLPSEEKKSDPLLYCIRGFSLHLFSLFASLVEKTYW